MLSWIFKLLREWDFKISLSIYYITWISIFSVHIPPYSSSISIWNKSNPENLLVDLYIRVEEPNKYTFPYLGLDLIFMQLLELQRFITCKSNIIDLQAHTWNGLISFISTLKLQGCTVNSHFSLQVSLFFKITRPFSIEIIMHIMISN